MRPSLHAYSHPNPSNRQFSRGASLLSQSNRGSAEMAFHLDRCVGNGAASHQHRSPSLGPGNRRQGVRFYNDDSKPTILPFRLSSQQSVNTCLERASSNHDTVAFASNQCAPSRQAWTYWYLEILGFLIGGGDSGIRLWHRRGSCCPKSESDSALWDC